MVNTFIDIAAKHGANVLRTGLFMVISSVAASSLRNSTTESLQEIVKDIKRARNNFREKRTATN